MGDECRIVRLLLITMNLTTGIPILDLPSFGISPTSGLYITSSVNFLTNVGADTSAVFDVCVMGLASIIVLNFLPLAISNRVVAAQKRADNPAPLLTEGQDGYYTFNQPDIAQKRIDEGEDSVDKFQSLISAFFGKSSTPEVVEPSSADAQTRLSTQTDFVASNVDGGWQR